MAEPYPIPADDTPLGPHIDDNRVRFTIYAPNKKSVHLLGSFNDEDRQRDALEPRDDGTWTITKELDPGEHRYRFLIDGELLVSDPYARAVDYGSKRGEEGKQPPASIVAVGKPGFAWRHGDWVRPPFNDLVFYEVGLRDAVDAPGHRLRGMMDRLDYVRGLGVNAIEPLPVTAFASDHGWGYDPTHLFAVHPDYGTAEDMKAFVDACHGRGIAVVLDIVLGHTGDQHPFNAMYSLEQSPWYGKALTEEEQEFGMPSFDYGKPGARRFAADVLRWWLGEYRVDGFRFDYLKIIGAYGHEAVNMMCDAARDACDNAYLVGEHLPEDPEEINQSRLSGTWHLRGGRMLRALLTGREMDGFNPGALGDCMNALDAEKEGYDHSSLMLNYIESHDEDRLVRELGEIGDDADTARRKLALAWTVLAAAPGEPMMYAGQEWGEDSPLDKKEQFAPLHWDRLDAEAGRGLAEHHRRVTRLRREHRSLRDGGFGVLGVDDGRRVATLHRWHDGGDEVVLAANFSGDAADAELPLPRGGAWREAFTDSRHEADGGDKPTLRWKLDPWTAAVFVRE